MRMIPHETTEVTTTRLLGGPCDGMGLDGAPGDSFCTRNLKPPYWATYVFIEVNGAGEREYLCMGLSKEKPDG